MENSKLTLPPDPNPPRLQARYAHNVLGKWHWQDVYVHPKSNRSFSVWKAMNQSEIDEMEAQFRG